jgi:hypothetical protein
MMPWRKSACTDRRLDPEIDLGENKPARLQVHVVRMLQVVLVHGVVDDPGQIALINSGPQILI